MLRAGFALWRGGFLGFNPRQGVIKELPHHFAGNDPPGVDVGVTLREDFQPTGRGVWFGIVIE
jgi:hypothetical protein